MIFFVCRSRNFDNFFVFYFVQSIIQLVFGIRFVRELMFVFVAAHGANSSGGAVAAPT